MTPKNLTFFAALLTIASVQAADQRIAIRFQAMVGKEKFACGQTYTGIGTTASRIAPRDFRFYVHNVRLIDEKGNAVPVQLDQGGKWQLDDTALLDFEDGTWSCVNGTREVNDQLVGTVPEGHYTGLLFTVGVPFNKNHTELTSQPPPLNLTALSWVWNAGRKFARLDFASAGQPHGFTVHLGSTGCMPNDSKITIPTECSSPNRPEVKIEAFHPDKDVVIADLAALLKDTNVDINQPKTAEGCMSAQNDSDCAGIFLNLGLPFADKPARPQTFFRKADSSEWPLSVRAAK
jgi:uncharacterized repeat protein (TIGR04052 family)